VNTERTTEVKKLVSKNNDVAIVDAFEKISERMYKLKKSNYMWQLSTKKDKSKYRTKAQFLVAIIQ